MSSVCSRGIIYVFREIVKNYKDFIVQRFHKHTNEILAVGGNLGYKYLNFCILDQHLQFFESFDYNTSEEHDVFMELPF